MNKELEYLLDAHSQKETVAKSIWSESQVTCGSDVSPQTPSFLKIL